MSLRHSWVRGVAGACAILAVAVAGYGDDFMNKFDVYGAAGMDVGQFVSYKYYTSGDNFYHQWVQDNYVWVGLKTQFNPRLQGVFGVMGWLQYNEFPDSLLADASRVSSPP